MPSILVCNDDGVHAAGIRALADALRPLGEVTVVAPDRERSAASHALTLHAPLRVCDHGNGFYAVDGTPADCVYLGALHVLERKPALIVSGVNHGLNIGDDVSYSGTIAAAIEGTLLGVPSFAISQEAARETPRGSQSGRFDFTRAAAIAQAVARRLLGGGLPSPDTLLSVNVPHGEIKGVRVVRQGKRTYDEVVHQATDPRGNPYYWIGSGPAPHVEQEADTDYMAVRSGYVSVCPLHLDHTHHPSLARMQHWSDLDDGRRATLDA